MLTIKIINDNTGTTEIGNYHYTVEVNGRVIDKGEIKGHVRSEPWTDLVRKMLELESPFVQVRPTYGQWTNKVRTK